MANFQELLHRLLPKDDRFFILLAKGSDNLVMAAREMQRFPGLKTREERKAFSDALHVMESEGDTFTHQTFELLNKSFLTPLDREDIHALASYVDDVLDCMDSAANRIYLFNVESVPQKMAEILPLLLECTQEIDKAFDHLWPKPNPKVIIAATKAISRLEHQVDDIYHAALCELFESNLDAVEIIKLKEIYQGLENAVDKCEDLGDVFEAIVLKHF